MLQQIAADSHIETSDVSVHCVDHCLSWHTYLGLQGIYAESCRATCYVLSFMHDKSPIIHLTGSPAYRPFGHYRSLEGQFDLLFVAFVDLLNWASSNFWTGTTRLESFWAGHSRSNVLLFVAGRRLCVF